MNAPRVELPPWDERFEPRIAGRSLPRVDAREKVTGRARYTADVRLPGMLFARVLRSPLPHARIRSIDESAAASLRGVHAVVHRGNAPEIAWYGDSVLFPETTRFVGDEVAAVAAESEEIAEDAARLIEVRYESLPFVVDLVDALRPGAPLAREGSAGNTGEVQVYERGDPERGLRDADVVIDETYTTQVALHNALEAHGSVAAWESDRLTLWESTQSVFDVRRQVADALGLPHHAVRVIKQYMGGGFGAKQVAWKQAVIAALLSRRTGRPVHLVLDREAENLAVGNRNATRQRVRLGARRDGTLTAITARIDAQVGAYDAGGESSLLSGPYQRLYRCEHVRTEQRPVFTNTGPSVAFRAPGHVEAAFGLESAMDELARALEIDPVELRRRNYAEHDQVMDLPYSTPASLRLCYDRAGEAFGWPRAGRESAAPASSAGARLRRGTGMAAHDWGGGGHPPAYAWVKVNADGTAEVVTGTQDIGTGTRTGITLVAAEELGLPPERIAVRLGDTASGPYAPVSAGSATQASIGPAVRAAAADARRQILEAAGRQLEERPERLTLRDAQVCRDGGNFEPLAPLEDVTRHMAPNMVIGSGSRAPNAEGYSVRTFGAQFVEVEVDESTGEVRVISVAASHDCGRVIDPLMVESQVVGGVVQGLGFALLEEQLMDHRLGLPLNANLEEYRVPTAVDVPAVDHHPIDLPDPIANSTGAKGIGEPPLVPTAPAIVNAVQDAIGVRIRALPLTPRRVLDAIAERDANGGAR